MTGDLGTFQIEVESDRDWNFTIFIISFLRNILMNFFAVVWTMKEDYKPAWNSLTNHKSFLNQISIPNFIGNVLHGFSFLCVFSIAFFRAEQMKRNSTNISYSIWIRLESKKKAKKYSTDNSSMCLNILLLVFPPFFFSHSILTSSSASLASKFVIWLKTPAFWK